MFYIHKILPLLLLPFPMMLLCIIAGLVLKKRILLIISLFIAYIFSIPVSSVILTNYLEYGLKRLTPADVPTADAVVVLSGCGVEEKGRDKVIEWQSPNRFLGGIQLFRAGKASRIIFTGGWIPGTGLKRPEGDILAEEAEKIGIPKPSILKTGKVSTTEEEAIAVASILHASETSSWSSKIVEQPKILLVTSAYHMKRARYLFEHEGLNVIEYPVGFNGSDNIYQSILSILPDSGSLNSSETSIREIYGLLYYKLKNLKTGF